METQDVVMRFVQERGHAPGEYLCDLTGQLPGVSDEELEEVLTQLVRNGKLKLHIRKSQFLHLRPVS